MYDLWKENIRMKGAKEFLDCYKVVNNLESVAKDMKKASEDVNETMSKLEKEN